MTKPFKNCLLLVCAFTSLIIKAQAQGTWIKVAHPAPDYNNGTMLLLTDGTVMAKACNGGIDTTGILWDVLRPDDNGSYVNGVWSRGESMKFKRLYCSSQMLRNGNVYVAGGEYGNGDNNGEVFDPLAQRWTTAGPMPAGFHIFDGNSALLPDGRVLQGIVIPSKNTVIYDPATNGYSLGPTAIGSHNEAAWLKLPDNSILFVDIDSRKSERFIPSQNTWVRDADVPVSLYDTFGKETGAAFLLPDGRAFFIGGRGYTAYYQPSGTDSPGVWSAGPMIPDSLSAPDAAAAMMTNGKILCAFSPLPRFNDVFRSPTWFYEFDYLTIRFTRISAPDGAEKQNYACYNTMMLALPDGNILFTSLASNQYYIYQPDGAPVASGKPRIDNIVKLDCKRYMATGRGFNGISEGAGYGDDWQMSTNYPLIRLVLRDNLYGNHVHYARTYNWNSTGVMRGNLKDTVYFTLPEGLPDGNYDVEAVANGIHSTTYSFTTCNTVGASSINASVETKLVIYPNPATNQAYVNYDADGTEVTIQLIDNLGRIVMQKKPECTLGNSTYQLDLKGTVKGMYTLMFIHRKGVTTGKLLVE